MTNLAVYPQTVSFSQQVLATGSFIGKIALTQITQAVEWLKIQAPIAMKEAMIIAQKVAIISKPYLAMFAAWSIQNRHYLGAGAAGFFLGSLLTSLFQRNVATHP